MEVSRLQLQREENHSAVPRWTVVLCGVCALTPATEDGATRGAATRPPSRSAATRSSSSHMSRHTRFLSLAAAAAEQSPLETKHGSVLVRGGKVLGSGHNSDRSHYKAAPGDSSMVSLHSEVRARK